MGPDLTGEYRKLGPEGMRVMLESLYFPAMLPLFHDRPLTTGEQRDLAAFIHGSDALPTTSSGTPELAAVAVGGCAVLLGIAGAFWRNRLRKVRKPLAAAGGNRT
jgi:hypothetical protein